MPAVTSDALLTQLSWRYAVKKFDPSRKIPAATWAALERATALSPSSYGLQLWRFVVVNDPSVRARLRPASWNQPQITDASHLIVFCRKAAVTPGDVDRYVHRIAEVREQPLAAIEGYKQMMLGTVTSLTPEQAAEWAGRQVYIALGFFLAAAAMLEIDACPMEGIDAAQYDQMLGLRDQGYAALCAATAGYRHADDPIAGLKKVRYPLEDVVIRV